MMVSDDDEDDADSFRVCSTKTRNIKMSKHRKYENRSVFFLFLRAEGTESIHSAREEQEHEQSDERMLSILFLFLV